MSRRTRAWSAVAVTVSAFVVLACIALRTPIELAFYKYPAAAELHLAGALDPERLIDFSPLYLALHVAARQLTSVPEIAIMALQTVLAAAIVGMLFILVRRRLGSGWALVAAVLLLFNRNVLVHQSILEPEIVLLFFLLAMLVARERPGPGAALAAGTAGALALATRPSLLPLLVLLPVADLVEAGGGGARARAWPQIARRAAGYALPVALVLGLLVVRSARITGDPLTPAMNPGTVFFEGNNPLSFGTSAVYPPAVARLTRQPVADDEPDRAHRFYREVARASAGRTLTVREVNAYWRDRAMAFIRDEPLRWLRLELGKVTLAFHNVRLHDVSSAWLLERRLGWLPTVPFALVGALALVGLLVEAASWRRALLFYALLASQMLVMLVFYVSARQRLALLPAAVYFAVVALARMRRPGRGRYVLLAALLGLCLVLPHPQLAERNHATQRGLEAQSRSNRLQAQLGNDPVAWRVGAAAELVASRGADLMPERPAFLANDDRAFEARVVEAFSIRDERRDAIRFDRALARLQAGQNDLAEGDLAALAEAGFTPYRVGMPTSLATYRALLAPAGSARSRDLLLEALRTAPGDPFALAALAAQHGDEEARSRLETYWSGVDAAWLLGRAHLRAGNGPQAVDALRRAVTLAPNLRVAQFDWAAARAAEGDLDAAVDIVVRALSTSVTPVTRHAEITALARSWLAVAPEDPLRRFTAARILHIYGELAAAAAIIEPLEQAIRARLVAAGGTAIGPLEQQVLREAASIRQARNPPPGLAP